MMTPMLFSQQVFVLTKPFGGFPQSNKKAEENLSAAKRLGSFHASDAMDWWEHYIVKWCKRLWMELDSLKWDECRLLLNQP